MNSLAIGEVRRWDWARPPNHVTVSTLPGLFTPLILPRPPSGRCGGHGTRGWAVASQSTASDPRAPLHALGSASDRGGPGNDAV